MEESDTTDDAQPGLETVHGKNCAHVLRGAGLVVSALDAIEVGDSDPHSRRQNG